jgi:hypothetical protein
VAELLAVANFDAMPHPVRGPHVIDEESWYDPSIPEFQLSIHEFSDLTRIPPAGPQVLLCTQGEAYITVDREHRSSPEGCRRLRGCGTRFAAGRARDRFPGNDRQLVALTTSRQAVAKI